MNGSYEVLAAYGMARHGKWLYSYNTETNDLVDLPARGHVDTAEKAKAASRYKRQLLLDLSTVTAETPLTFSVAEGNHDGWLLDMASIVIEK